MKRLARNFQKTLNIYEKRKRSVTAFIFALAVLFPFYISIRDIAIDSIPFWYDPARDLLMAWDNLHKFTLIGPPSGIPGIFYGPHWLWFLSLGLLLSKDPRVVTAAVLAIPYFTVFPFLLFKFSKLFGTRITVLLWLLFIFGYKTYTTYIWSPHLAALFFLIMVYILVFTDLNKKGLKNLLRLFLAGISAGLLVNVHISFGIVMTVAGILFLTVEYFFSPIIISSFILGLLLSFTPNIIFEMRHGFHQTQAIIYTFNQSFLYNSTVVGYPGLSRIDIIKEFLGVLSRLLNTPQNITYALYALIFLHFILKRKTYFSRLDRPSKKLLLYVFIAVACLSAVYLMSKNPIWAYHFLGVEILVLFLLGFILARFSLLKNLVTIWVIGLAIFNIYLLTKPSEIPFYKIPNLATKKYIVSLIYKDTGRKPFAVYAYSSAIYTFDYDYLFRWYGNYKFIGQLPQDPKGVKSVYLIIPATSTAVKTDFINYRTPQKEFRTVNEWNINDGTTIIRREKTETGT